MAVGPCRVSAAFPSRNDYLFEDETMQFEWQITPRGKCIIINNNHYQVCYLFAVMIIMHFKQVNINNLVRNLRHRLEPMNVSFCVNWKFLIARIAQV